MMIGRSSAKENTVSSPKAPPFRTAAACIAVAVLYFVSGRIGFCFAFATRQVTAVWPPTGMAIAALLLWGPRVWPGVALGAFLINATSHEPLSTAAGIAFGNTLGPVVGAWLLRRRGFDTRLRRVEDVLNLVGLSALFAMTITATNGVANLAFGGVVPWSAYGSVFWVWWAGDAMGVILVAPLILAWSAGPRAISQKSRRAELVVLALALFAVSAPVLSGAHQLQYLVYPFVIWTALRFGQRETASAILYVAALATWEAIHDRGPFASGGSDERLILLEIFMAVTAVMGLVLGAMTNERSEAVLDLLRAHDSLELRVKERTSELAAANVALVTLNGQLTRRTKELAEKNEEVEAFVYIVSHDLRAPLVNLQGFASELETSCRELRTVAGEAGLTRDPRIVAIVDDDIPGALRYVRASATKFQRLIDALLALSRLGRSEYRTERVSVDDIVRSTLDTLRRTVDDSGATVEVSALPEAMGDTTALGQVFANLVTNALHYLHPDRSGRIEIGGVLENGFAHYWVRDNGRGIPESAKGRLFQVFQRFHPTVVEGEGMGLAIVKRTVQRHGGRIWAQSDAGLGTTFHLTLVPADVTAPEETHVGA